MLRGQEPESFEARVRGTALVLQASTASTLLSAGDVGQVLRTAAQQPAGRRHLPAGC
jgi:hypothetical protein